MQNRENSNQTGKSLGELLHRSEKLDNGNIADLAISLDESGENLEEIAKFALEKIDILSDNSIAIRGDNLPKKERATAGTETAFLSLANKKEKISSERDRRRALFGLQTIIYNSLAYSYRQGGDSPFITYGENKGGKAEDEAYFAKTIGIKIIDYIDFTDEQIAKIREEAVKGKLSPAYKIEDLDIKNKLVWRNMTETLVISRKMFNISLVIAAHILEKFEEYLMEKEEKEKTVAEMVKKTSAKIKEAIPEKTQLTTEGKTHEILIRAMAEENGETTIFLQPKDFNKGKDPEETLQEIPVTNATHKDPQAALEEAMEQMKKLLEKN